MIWFDLSASISKIEMPMVNKASGYTFWGTLRLRRAIEMTYIAMRDNITIKTPLLSLVFMRCIPRMLKRGREKGRSRKAFSLRSSLKADGAKEKASLLVLYPMVASKIRMTLKEAIKECVDNGVA